MRLRSERHDSRLSVLKPELALLGGPGRVRDKPFLVITGVDLLECVLVLCDGPERLVVGGALAVARRTPIAPAGSGGRDRG